MWRCKCLVALHFDLILGVAGDSVSSAAAVMDCQELIIVYHPHCMHPCLLANACGCVASSALFLHLSCSMGLVKHDRVNSAVLTNTLLVTFRS